ncbi:uncharacterized protein LOC123528317 isoform X2 [Mercenaria mercenaria]|uniref:uncharacterized protein LOC123528317 isoform X2 n=1 Tax=Mercenaria mercenaria TaxID=6596 RepID=UPI00234F6957|nr:uncharacterized protein LOC123528317 isoform X2 [Mercenaria mercenaria]
MNYSSVSTLNRKGRQLNENHVCLYRIFVDASAFGYGGYVENNVRVSSSVSQGIVKLESQKLPEVSRTEYENFSKKEKTIECMSSPEVDFLANKESPEVDLLVYKASPEVDNSVSDSFRGTNSLINTLSSEAGDETSSRSPEVDSSICDRSHDARVEFSSLSPEADSIASVMFPKADSMLNRMSQEEGIITCSMSPEADRTVLV